MFWPLCKKMLLILLFADNIFSVVEESRKFSLTPFLDDRAIPLAVIVARTPAKSINEASGFAERGNFSR